MYELQIRHPNLHGLAHTLRIKRNTDIYNDENTFDHLWIGPKFTPKDPDYSRKTAEILRVFQSHNFIRELVDNWKNGLIGNGFNWRLKTTEGNRERAAEAEVQLQRWIEWANQQFLSIDPSLKPFKQNDPWSEYLVSLGVTGEGNLRLWQPTAYSNDPDPIHQIHLHVPQTGSVTVDWSDEGFAEKIAYSYKNKKEVHSMNEQGQVIVVTTTTANGLAGTEDEPLVIDTGGRWLLSQTHMPTLITDSAIKKQASICHALTMKIRTTETAGFRERVLINAEFPDPEHPVERGPGTDMYITGVPTGDTSNPSFTTPSVHESNPVPVDNFASSINIDKMLLYMEFRQAHLLYDSAAALSAESRIQMRQAFELYLRGWKTPVESAIVNVLNIVLRLLGFDDLEAVVELNTSTGKLSAEERAEVINEFQSGLLSKATAIAKLRSVDDVDSELALQMEEARALAGANQPASSTTGTQPETLSPAPTPTES